MLLSLENNVTVTENKTPTPVNNVIPSPVKLSLENSVITSPVSDTRFQPNPFYNDLSYQVSPTSACISPSSPILPLPDDFPPVSTTASHTPQPPPSPLLLPEYPNATFLFHGFSLSSVSSPTSSIYKTPSPSWPSWPDEISSPVYDPSSPSWPSLPDFSPAQSPLAPESSPGCKVWHGNDSSHTPTSPGSSTPTSTRVSSPCHGDSSPPTSPRVSPLTCYSPSSPCSTVSLPPTITSPSDSPPPTVTSPRVSPLTCYSPASPSSTLSPPPTITAPRVSPLTCYSPASPSSTVSPLPTVTSPSASPPFHGFRSGSSMEGSPLYYLRDSAPSPTPSLPSQSPPSPLSTVSSPGNSPTRSKSPGSSPNMSTSFGNSPTRSKSPDSSPVISASAGDSPTRYKSPDNSPMISESPGRSPTRSESPYTPGESPYNPPQMCDNVPTIATLPDNSPPPTERSALMEWMRNKLRAALAISEAAANSGTTPNYMPESPDPDDYLTRSPYYSTGSKSPYSPTRSVRLPDNSPPPTERSALKEWMLKRGRAILARSKAAANSQTRPKSLSRSESPCNSLQMPESPGNSPTRSESPYNSPRMSESPGNSPTRSESPYNSPHMSESPGNSPTRSESPYNSPLMSELPGNSPTRSESPNYSPRMSASPDNSPTRSASPSNSPQMSESPGNSPTRSESPYNSPQLSLSPGNFPTRSDSPNYSPRMSESPGNSPTRSASPYNSPEMSESPGNSPTRSDSPYNSPQMSLSPGNSPTRSDSPNYSPRMSESPGNSPTRAESPYNSPLISELPDYSLYRAPSNSLYRFELPYNSPQMPEEIWINSSPETNNGSKGSVKRKFWEHNSEDSKRHKSENERFRIVCLEVEYIKQNNETRKDLTQIGCSVFYLDQNGIVTNSDQKFFRVIQPPRMTEYLSMKMRGDLLKSLHIQQNETGQFEFRDEFEIINDESNKIKCITEKEALEEFVDFVSNSPPYVLVSLDEETINIILEKVTELSKSSVFASVSRYTSWNQLLTHLNLPGEDISMEFEDWFAKNIGSNNSGVISQHPHALDISSMLMKAVKLRLKHLVEVKIDCNFYQILSRISFPKGIRSTSLINRSPIPPEAFEYLEISNSLRPHLTPTIYFESVDVIDLSSDSDEDQAKTAPISWSILPDSTQDNGGISNLGYYTTGSMPTRPGYYTNAHANNQGNGLLPTPTFAQQIINQQRLDYEAQARRLSANLARNARQAARKGKVTAAGVMAAVMPKRKKNKQISRDRAIEDERARRMNQQNQGQGPLPRPMVEIRRDREIADAAAKSANLLNPHLAPLTKEQRRLQNPNRCTNVLNTCVQAKKGNCSFKLCATCCKQQSQICKGHPRK